MKNCVVCEHNKPEREMYSDTWCHRCVLEMLDTQARESQDRKVRPQVFKA